MRYVGIDIWQVKSGTIFNHFLLTDSIEEAEQERKQISELTKKRKRRRGSSSKKRRRSIKN